MIPIFGIEFDCKAPNVPDCLGRAQGPANCADTVEHFGFLANAIEELGGRQMGHVVGYLELAPRSCRSGMDHSTR